MTATEADEDTLGADRTTVWSMGVSLLPKLRNAPERHQDLTRAATEILVRNLDVDVDRLATAAAAVRARGRERGAAGLTGERLDAYSAAVALALRAIRLIRAADAHDDRASAVRLLDALSDAKPYGYLPWWTWPPTRRRAARAHRWISRLWEQVEQDLAPIPVPTADSDDSDGDAAAGGGTRLRIVATPAEPDRWEDQLALIRASGATYEANERCWYLFVTPAQLAAGALDPLFKAAADHRTRVSTDQADNAASSPPSP